MESQALADFSGGFIDRRSSVEFDENQWAQLHGFVLEDSGLLRSQWPLQKVAGITDVVALGTYLGHTNRSFLVAVKSDGSIVWTEAPDASLDSSDAGMTPTWTALENSDLSEPTDVGDVSSRRPVCTVPLRQQSTAGFRSGLVLNSVEMDDGSASVIVYEGDGGLLRFVETLDHWPEDDADDALPKAAVAALWNGVLCLGDTEWKDDPSLPLSDTNKKRVKNGVWLSDPGDPFHFDPDSVLFPGDAHSAVTGLHVVDAGLLVLTSNPSSGVGGVYLLRGTPDSYVLETVREGVGAPRAAGCVWGYTGTVCWVTEFGEVWQTDGSRVVRLDAQGLGFDDRDAAGDACSSFGPYLLTHREDRLLALRAFDDEESGAWTELNVGTLTGLDLRYGGMLQDAFYFVADGEVWRWTRAMPAGPSERGSGSQGVLDLTIGSRTLEGGDGHRKTFWHSVGVRATAGSDDPESAELVSVDLAAGPVRDTTAPRLTRTAALDLAPTGERVRGDMQVRGIGPSREFAAELTFRGDVVVEQVTVFYDPGEPSRSTEGV